jgi:chorismate mutase/prephenate dehydratase
MVQDQHLLSTAAADISKLLVPPASSMNAPPKSLDELRREIDALDDRIHDALIARAEVAGAVRAAKGADGAVFRPGREANVLRRLVARHHGDLPAIVIVRIWREIMTASSRLQGQLTVAVAPNAAGGAGLDLARDHFGTLTAIQPVASIAQALSALMEARAQIALVPAAEDVPEEPWWRGFGAGPRPQLNVLARVPFTADARGGGALLVGRQAFDPSGADHGFVVVETRAEMSQARLRTNLETAGLSVLGFPAAIDDPAAGSLQLVELSVYAAPGDPRLAQVESAIGEGTRLRVIGGYATPLALPRG